LNHSPDLHLFMTFSACSNNVCWVISQILVIYRFRVSLDGVAPSSLEVFEQSLYHGPIDHFVILGSSELLLLGLQEACAPSLLTSVSTSVSSASMGSSSMMSNPL
jgi:hypothetical protein